MFTEEDGTIINNEKSKVFVRIQLKVSTLAFEAGDFNIFLRFWGFLRSSYQSFSYKKPLYFKYFYRSGFSF